MVNIVIYLTASCPYCIRAKMLLDDKEVDYIEHDINSSKDLHDEMIQRSHRFSVPQIFIDDLHIGGYDDMHLLELNDELDRLLFPGQNTG